MTDKTERRDQPSAMPRHDRRVASTTGLLRRIELVSRDLGREAERDGALGSDAALALANSIKDDIELVIRQLRPHDKGVVGD